MTNDNVQVVALFVIKQGDTFANTYGLCKVLSRAFEVSNCLDVVASLNLNGYINVRKEDSINYYDITPEGEKFMNTNRSETVEVLLNEFPKDAEFINALMK